MIDIPVLEQIVLQVNVQVKGRLKIRLCVPRQYFSIAKSPSKMSCGAQLMINISCNLKIIKGADVFPDTCNALAMKAGPN